MRYLLFVTLALSLVAKGQLKSYIIGVKGDTLNRVDARGLKQGPWVIRTEELRGNPGYEEEGYFVADKKEGRWVRYSLQGDKQAVENYRWGQKDGKCDYYNGAEDLIREESWLATDPKNPYDTVPVVDLRDPTKVVKYVVVKIEEPSVKHGTWRYYNPLNGRIEKTEQWQLNKLKNPDDETGADDELAPIDPATGKPVAKKDEKKQVAKPKEVLDYEKKNSGKKKIKVRSGETGG